MDDFSDDEFDNLNDEVLQELENNAIQATQAQKPSQFLPGPSAHQSTYDQGFEDDDLDDTVVIDQLAQPPPGLPRQQQQHQQQQQQQQHQALPIQQPRHGTGLAAGTHRWNQHLPQPKPTYPPRPQYRPTPHHQIRQPLASQRYPSAAPSQRYQSVPAAPSQQPPRQSQFARPPLPISRQYAAQASQGRHGPGPAHQSDVITTLQARLSELESDLTAARGEASILRSKYDKAVATHDAEVARLKKENAEQTAKQERLAEQARIAERTLATELQFARQDLREELGRSKSKRKDGPSTPRKNRTWGVPDGFDGVEILSSPSKGQGLRRKDSGPALPAPSDRTPTRGKRKRPAVDSPTFALETDGGDFVLDDAQTRSLPTGRPPALLRTFRFDYLRLFLDHAAAHGQPPTFEVFSRYAFPSDTKRSLASIILQKLPQMGNPGEPLSLLIEFSDMLIELWHRCLSERYHGPIYHLVNLVLYTLELNAADVAPHVIASLVPVCATTCKLVVLPRLKSADGDLTSHADPGVRQLFLHIDVPQCLALLHLAALGCIPPPLRDVGPSEAPESSPQEEYWKTMELNFVLMILSPTSPEAEWLTMMSMLRASVTPDSIGPIPSPATDPASGRAETRTREGVAAILIDCVTSYLCDPPQWATGRFVKAITARSAALATLMAFATSPYGALQIAESGEAIPRLVAGLCWAMDRLYDSDLPLRRGQAVTAIESQLVTDIDAMDVDQHNGDSDGERDGDGVSGRQAVFAGEDLFPKADPMTLLCRIISQATALLHFLVTDPQTSEVANISTKLAASYGGSQRYFLTLARLNFAEEDLVLEAGIDADTVERAHELLELAVTPDEGEEISEMFD